MTLQLVQIAHVDNITVTARHVQTISQHCTRHARQAGTFFPSRGVPEPVLATGRADGRRLRDIAQQHLYYSPVPDDQAVAVDAMSHS